MNGSFSIYLLGELEVQVGETGRKSRLGRKTRAILACLIATRRARRRPALCVDI